MSEQQASRPPHQMERVAENGEVIASVTAWARFPALALYALRAC